MLGGKTCPSWFVRKLLQYFSQVILWPISVRFASKKSLTKLSHKSLGTCFTSKNLLRLQCLCRTVQLTAFFAYWYLAVAIKIWHVKIINKQLIFNSHVKIFLINLVKWHTIWKPSSVRSFWHQYLEGHNEIFFSGFAQLCESLFGLSHMKEKNSSNNWFC